MKGINYAEFFFGIITCLDREFYGRSLRGDSTVDPSNLLKNLKYLVAPTALITPLMCAAFISYSSANAFLFLDLID